MKLALIPVLRTSVLPIDLPVVDRFRAMQVFSNPFYFCAGSALWWVVAFGVVRHRLDQELA